jgi:hypothetical protein
MPSPYAAPRPFLLPTIPVTFPTSLYPKLPGIALQPKLPGLIRGCPPPLGGHQLCVVIFVQAGDTLSALACRYRTSVQTLQQLNGLGQSTTLIAGRTLIVPFGVLKTTSCG